ncbi:MAG TPA: hypothetical protein PKD54_12810 [Pirellulaceae bacterium]|nr:hypothetical protein [Pirellulaceae bacterium]
MQTIHKTWSVIGMILGLIICGFSANGLTQVHVQAASLPIWPAPAAVAQQDDDEQEADKVKEVEGQDEAGKDTEDEAAEEPIVETIRIPIEMPGPREVRLHLWDGSIVAGDIGIDAIHIETRFGRLQVPISNILNFRPGLQNVPTLNDRINLWVEELGDRDFQVRELARRQLSAMGMLLRNHIRTFDDGGSAERKKHLAALVEEIESLAEESEYVSGGDSVPLDQEDTVTTGEFTIVGRIVENEFELSTKYGLLKLRLEDIKRADRSWGQTAESVRKNVDIGATDFFQRTPKATRIFVKPGDRVSIRCSGNVSWSSWNMSSTPDGLANQGSWNGAPSGCVMARIGKSSEYIKIGSRGDFVAKVGGELFLGVAMQDNYANQRGYQWDGNYQARIVVEPGNR